MENILIVMVVLFVIFISIILAELEEVKMWNRKLKKLFTLLVENKLHGDVYWYSEDLWIPYKDGVEPEDLEEVISDLRALASNLGYVKITNQDLQAVLKKVWKKVENSKERKSKNGRY